MGKLLEERIGTDWRSLYILTVVAFLGSLKMGTMGHNLWPYVLLNDPSTTETFYGYMLSVSSIGNIVAAFITGYVSNVISHTKPSLVLGKVMALIGAGLYLAVELVETNRRFVFVVMEICFGFGMGLTSVMRTHIAMASTEEDRPKAVSMITLAMTIGMATGPFIMSILTLLGYPGYSLIGDLHLNLYTAPVYLMAITTIVAIFLIIFLFDGRMRIIKPLPKTEIEKPKNNEIPKKNPLPLEIDPKTLPKGKRFDKVAVFVCCMTRFLMALGMVFGHSLSSPYMMTAFRWTGEEFVFYSSIMHVFSGLFGIGWSLLYMTGVMRNKISERRAIVAAILMKLSFFLVTYPYPFYSNTIAYEVLSVNETTGKSRVLEPGCKTAYAWCAETPAVNPWLYCLAQIILMGLSIPLMMLNLEILYSKVLGQIKQGTMQSVFMICGDILQIFGPIFMTQIYESTGPRYIWLIIIAVNATILALWLIFYNRMISSSRRLRETYDAYVMTEIDD